MESNVLTTEDLERALAQAGLEAPVRSDEVTGSTNTTALEMAAAGAPEWTLVSAGHQTAGRGRLGRQWLDRPGSTLMFSFVLRPRMSAESFGLLPLLAGVAMARAAGPGVACKWPNDLMVADEKVGGILAESVLSDSRLDHVVIGIGVNLGRAPEVAGAAALRDAEATSLLGTFLSGFRASYRPGDPSFGPSVMAAYREVSQTIGRDVQAVTVDGERILGRAIDVDECGSLLVELPGGSVRTVSSGEIAHLRR